jgi:NitT/TauT family transport system permease protein
MSDKYWKKSSRIWPVLTVAGYLAALIISLLIPAAQSKVNQTPYRVVLITLTAVFLLRYIFGFFFERLRIKVNHQAQIYFVLALLLISWDLLTTKTNTLLLPFFPGPAQILAVMVDDYKTLLISTFYSMRLLVIGFILGTIIGLTSGVLMGWFRQWSYWLFPALKILGVIPATAWIPIAMICFPSSFAAEIFLIILSVWFPVAYMTSSGIANTPRSYFEAARTLGGGQAFLVFKVAIPAAMPSVFTGIYTATGISFATLVVSEMIGAKAGLGWYINWAKGWSNYAKVYSSIVIMAVVFSIVMAIIFKIRDRVLIWQKGLLQ